MDGISITHLDLLIQMTTAALRHTTDPAARLAMNVSLDTLADAASEGLRSLNSLDGLPSREPTPC